MCIKDDYFCVGQVLDQCLYILFAIVDETALLFPGFHGHSFVFVLDEGEGVMHDLSVGLDADMIGSRLVLYFYLFFEFIENFLREIGLESGNKFLRRGWLLVESTLMDFGDNILCCFPESAGQIFV